MLVLPGRRGGPSVPPLFYPTVAAMRRGADPSLVEWRDIDELDSLTPEKIIPWIERQAAPAFDAIEPDASVVIAKSLGTLAAMEVARRSIPAIWVTPLLTNPDVVESLRRATAPFLLVGGTADGFWDGAIARSLTPHVLELPGVDHGLLLPGPLRLSAANIGSLSDAAETFLDGQVWPSGRPES